MERQASKQISKHASNHACKHAHAQSRQARNRGTHRHTVKQGKQVIAQARNTPTSNHASKRVGSQASAQASPSTSVHFPGVAIDMISMKCVETERSSGVPLMDRKHKDSRFNSVCSQPLALRSHTHATTPSSWAIALVPPTHSNWVLGGDTHVLRFPVHGPARLTRGRLKLRL